MTYEIKVRGQTIAFSAGGGESVLDAAERAGYVMPYSCRKGVCATCEGEIVAGDVVLGRSKRLSGPAHKVRLCLARPCGDIEIAPASIARSEPQRRKRFHASIYRIDRPTADVSILHLRLPIGRRAPFRAGQYARLFFGDGESRNYSLANPPHDNDQAQLHIRHIPGGRFSETYLAELKPGDTVDLELPYGLSSPTDGGTAPMILVGTGTGFAPLKSMIEGLARRRQARRVHLFWGGRTLADLYQCETAQQWSERLPWFRFTPVLSRPAADWAGCRGHVQGAVLAEYPDLGGYEVFACGNLRMVEDAKSLLTTQGLLPAADFHADAFLPSGESDEQ